MVVDASLASLSTRVKHAKPFVPSMFMAQDPQMPSRQDLLKLSVESCSSLILSRTSSIIGPQSFRSTVYVCILGFFPSSGSHLYILKSLGSSSWTSSGMAAELALAL